MAATRDTQFVKSLGAADVVDFESEPFKDCTTGADVVIDTVGGAVQERSFRVVNAGGIIVSSVSPPSIDLAQVYDVRTAFFIVRVRSEELEKIGQLFDDGTLQTDLGIVLGLADARRAHQMLAGEISRPRGKIVLDTNLVGNRR